MKRRSMIGAGLGVAALALGGGAFWRWNRRRLPALPPLADAAEFEAAYHAALPPPLGPMTVYHLGHSLTGRDMPLFLAQMAGHSHHSQLGWGTSLRQHWEPHEVINGYDTENAHAHYRPARQALASGQYDAVILTEMSTLEDSLRWHVTPHYVAKWAKAARAGRPDVRVYLYQSWRELDHPNGWVDQVRRDLPAFWEQDFLRRAFAAGSGPVHLIPGGAVLVEAVVAAEAGQIRSVQDRSAFFGTHPDGTPDLIHLSDLGDFLVALTHHEVLYQGPPETLPLQLQRADGGTFRLSAQTAADLQGVVQRVVAGLKGTGIST